MKRIAALSFLLFAAAACGDDGPATTPDAEITDMPDAEIESPDADNSCTTDTACVGHSADDVLCNSNGTAVITCTALGDCLDAVATSCTGGDVCVDDGTPACEPPAPTCKDDPACVGETDGATLCVGNAVVTCATVDGCLAATAAACTTAGEVCVDDGTPACQANGDGESCATAQYITEDTTISGADFTADFADEQDWTGAGCAEGNVADANVEGVFAVNLAAYQRITVTETGGLPAILGIQQTTCGNTEACLDSDATAAQSVTYFTDVPTTLYVYVGAVDAAPATTDYSISFAFTTCGDGAVAATEICDDGNNANGDGCSAVCFEEFGYSCDDAAPTVCTAFEDLGMHDGGDTITDTTTGALAAGDLVYYTVTFTAPVHLTGTITTTADADFYVWLYPQDVPEDNPFYGSEDVDDTTETIGDDFDWYFTPGTYVLAVRAYEEISAGYTLTLNTVTPTHTDIGTFAPAATIANSTGGPITANHGAYHTITFDAPVLLDGSLTSTTGDLDLYMWAPGVPVFTSAVAGDEAWTDVELPAGTYYLELWAYADDPAVDVTSYTLSLSTTAVP